MIAGVCADRSGLAGARHARLLSGLALLVWSLLLAACAMPERREGYRVDHSHVAPGHSSRIYHLVIHYTGHHEARALRTLTGPHVSAHYVMPLPARFHRGEPLVYQLVEEHRRAWHAGVSEWGPRSNINDTSIGIEIINAGPRGTLFGLYWAPYPDDQIEAVIALARDIVARHDIDPVNVVAHSDIAPSRKLDPGPRFPWQRLYEAGIGAWPDEETVACYTVLLAAQPPSLPDVQAALRGYGYPLEVSGQMDAATRDVVRAFQLHFRQRRHDGVLDTETLARLWALLAKYRPRVLETLTPGGVADPCDGDDLWPVSIAPGEGSEITSTVNMHAVSNYP
ncbi:N-acetylmuramoyl-L-alanine amidase [Isoalcanivorax indicus]|uniref:N-acetylmuramoyl-L-alanine amidase n=1 Tax=Isoalcanivorax indicus TaxID=2202653 RepID=UPI001FEAC9B8|nr:N-acetylmuramoyl-L-alanine amidase [Isoalcanivorax indicus]